MEQQFSLLPFLCLEMKPNIRSWRKNWSFVNFQEETYQIQRKHWWLNKNGIWNVSMMALIERCLISTQTFLQVQTQVIGSKVNDGQSETRFLLVCLFIWCCLKNRICYVCTQILNGTFNRIESGQSTLIWWTFWICHHKTHCMDIYLEQDMKQSFHSNLFICSTKYLDSKLLLLFINIGESFQRVTRYLCETRENQS